MCERVIDNEPLIIFSKVRMGLFPLDRRLLPAPHTSLSHVLLTMKTSAHGQQQILQENVHLRLESSTMTSDQETKLLVHDELQPTHWNL